jgi:ribosomal protein S18 acetylase RimI-like enzyme
VNKSAIEVRRAEFADLERVLPLFDAYRRFYRLESDVERAREFLRARIQQNQSVIFLALDGDSAVGFTQLYPSFSSGAMAPVFVLNDLFVSPEARRHGVGTALLDAAADHGRRSGAVRLVLSTELTNTVAQSVYERAGWRRDTVFCSYQLTL